MRQLRFKSIRQRRSRRLDTEGCAAQSAAAHSQGVEPGVGIQSAHVTDLQAHHFRTSLTATVPGKRRRARSRIPRTTLAGREHRSRGSSATAVFLSTATPCRDCDLRASRSKVFTGGASVGLSQSCNRRHLVSITSRCHTQRPSSLSAVHRHYTHAVTFCHKSFIYRIY